MKTQDALANSLEKLIKSMLRAAKDEPMETKINVVRAAIVWFSQSRKLNPSKGDAGALLAEMQKMIEEGEPK